MTFEILTLTSQCTNLPEYQLKEKKCKPSRRNLTGACGFGAAEHVNGVKDEEKGVTGYRE
jgi:hypothetical protein